MVVVPAWRVDACAARVRMGTPAHLRTRIVTSYGALARMVGQSYTHSASYIGEYRVAIDACMVPVCVISAVVWLRLWCMYGRHTLRAWSARYVGHSTHNKNQTMLNNVVCGSRLHGCMVARDGIMILMRAGPVRYGVHIGRLRAYEVIHGTRRPLGCDPLSDRVHACVGHELSYTSAVTPD